MAGYRPEPEPEPDPRSITKPTCSHCLSSSRYLSLLMSPLTTQPQCHRWVSMSSTIRPSLRLVPRLTTKPPCHRWVSSSSTIRPSLLLIPRLTTKPPCHRWMSSMSRPSLLLVPCLTTKPPCHRWVSSTIRPSLLLVPRLTTKPPCHRWMSRINQRNPDTVYYVIAAAIAMVGLSFAAVPLYKIFCQTTGFGGATKKELASEKIESMKKIEDRLITVRFSADVASSMRWNFRPQQREVVVYPGETALAFYTARNPTDVPIIGISTYNITPYDAGVYFNKIQCFCFEEQRLNPHEQVDMPVFFYIDPEFAEDPKMENVKIVTLSYTFFEAKEGFELPIPDYVRPHATAKQ